MTKLSNKSIWITGASSGIGEQLVYQLAARGNRLIISARRKEILETVRANCPPKAQSNVFILPLDLSDVPALDSAARAALQIGQGIDVLFNNGGISQRSLVSETDFEVDRRLMEVNYFSAVKLSKLVLPNMIDRGGGHIVVTSSLVGKFGTPFRSAYSASKHALHGFFEALRAEVFDKGIGVTLFCGGYIKTNISFNAVTGDGSKHNQMDENQAKGKRAETAARAMIRAVEADKREVYFGGREVMGVYIKRFFPGLFAGIVKKMKISQTK
ncbi:MAG: SDR family oxidoreductase [Cyclobacteriaceae bacterium]|nr:SDR family oxidoreductase [Cyclobacteriaceae bacterium]